MSEERDQLAKVLAKMEKRLYQAEEGRRAVSVILIWIQTHDARFDTPGDLIHKIERLCKETLGEP